MRHAWVRSWLVLILSGCASVQNITGGDQDTEPPRLINATPPERSTRFDAPAILLEFDERVQLDRVRDRMLVSPPLSTAPDVRLAGPRGVEIKLNSPLEPATTYTFNLGDCVKDLTEGNAATGLAYVVSTGEALDSASFSGKVLNAFTGQPEKDMMVGLYAPDDTTAFRMERPAYMTRTDALGHFMISNLPNGRFSAFALRDKNANYRYDLPNEEIAFLDSAVRITVEDTLRQEHLLRSFLPASARQQVRSYSVTADGALELVMARAVDTIGLRDVARIGGELKWTPEFNAARDSVLLWPSDTTLLSQGSYEVMADQQVLDTLRYRQTRNMPYYMGLTAALVEAGDQLSIRLRSTRPITAIDSARISLERDSTSVPFRIVQDVPRSISLVFDTEGAASYRLLVLPKAVRDILGGTNDTLRATLGVLEEKSFGSLRVKLEGLDPAGRYLLQVLDGQQRIQHELPVTAELPIAVWERLTPGMRTLRLVRDSNGNGHWDTGEWALLSQPERTWYHPEQVNIRASWDVKIDWSPAPPSSPSRTGP
ncbi:MAG TPA: Ig-like domain-containing protein [Flavobacteriales bacterium]|nr:Ig-like domain-containing protein [Flavobacteriales bacterium]HNU55057.1 Ig-like domain-containing protein [Flavobacteriales bacterium]